MAGRGLCVPVWVKRTSSDSSNSQWVMKVFLWDIFNQEGFSGLVVKVLWDTKFSATIKCQHTDVIALCGEFQGFCSFFLKIK